MVAGFILSVLTIVAGDISGKFLAKYQPAKLAAAEWHFETQKEAPLVLGGILDEKTGEVKYALKIPYALSILAHGKPEAEVIGLNDIPKSLWPPLYVHYLFDGMVVIGMYLLFISGLFLFYRWRKKGEEWKPWLIKCILLGAPLSFLAIELGWIYAEVGRQPWIIVGIMRTDQAATTAQNVDTMFLLFTLLYLLLSVITCVVLYRLFYNRPAEEELKQQAEGTRT